MCTLRAVCEKKNRRLSGRIPSARPRSLPRLRTAAIRYTSRRNKFPAPSNCARLAICGLLYCAPVAMTIARAASSLPLSSTILYGRLPQSSRTTLCADHHLRAKFLRLRERAIRQFLPGHSGGKSQIVFNLGARTSLPARELPSRSPEHPALPKPHKQPLPGPLARRPR